MDFTAVTDALNEAQSLADRLYLAEDADSLLEAEGFVRTGDGWMTERADI